VPPLPVCSGAEVIAALGKIGYTVVRSRESHVRLNCSGRPPVTVPLQRTLARGTLASILRETRVTVVELIALL
jgi:predicted RNA binding protein YcfA (HicA-like mRNA interferase family)